MFQKRFFAHALPILTVLLCCAAAARADTVAFSFTNAGTATVLSPPPVADVQATADAQFMPFGHASFSALGMINFAIVNPNGSNPAAGTFTYDFGEGNTFFGTFTQELFPPDPQTGLTADTVSYTITDGTGIFGGATGTASGTASGFFISPTTVSFMGTGGGTITAPGLTAVPEPATMLLLGTGLAGVGAAIRKRKRKK